MNISPVEVPGYIVPYLVNECAGVRVQREGDSFTEIRIEPTSVFGMFLSRALRSDYKVKFYQMTLYIRAVGNRKAFSAEILEFKNNAEFHIDLSFEELENFYRFLDTIFNTSFYFFMTGYCNGSASRKKIKEGINVFMDRYDLMEYGYNENQMRMLYLRYRKGNGDRRSGSVSSFITNKSFHLKKFLG